MRARALAVACALAAVPALAALAAGYTFTRTPSHGDPGTAIHVRGTGCAYEGKPYQYATVRLYYRGDPEFSDPRASERFTIANDGTFEGDVAVPGDAPAGSYRLSADCYASDMVFPVGDTDFTVDGTPPTHPPTPRRTTPPPPSRPASPSPRPSPSRATATVTTPPVSHPPTPPPARRPTPRATPVPRRSPVASVTAAPIALPDVPRTPRGPSQAPAVAFAALLLGLNVAGLARARRRA